MATSILPEKFDSGDFPTWLRQFNCCASANGWTDEQKLQKLPAFLRGLAATYFHTLSDDEKDTFEHLVTSLQTALCPAVGREGYFREFEDRVLRGGEDPSVFLWSLQELLKKADPTLEKAATSALLSRQFMKGLPNTIRYKLLENNPTPKLDEMLSFSKQFLAIGDNHGHHPGLFAATDVVPSPTSIEGRLDKLTAAVEELNMNNSSYLATVQKKEPTSQFAGRQQPVRRVTCYFCSKEGHIARNCPHKRTSREQGPSGGSFKCQMCNGSGHIASQCANNWIVDNPNIKEGNRVANAKKNIPNRFVSTLNFKGVAQ